MKPLGNGNPEDRLKRRGIESSERAKMFGDVLEAVRGQGGFGRWRADPFSFDQAQKGFEVWKGYLGEAAVVTHGTSSHSFVMALSASAIVIIKVIGSSGETLKPQAS